MAQRRIKYTFRQQFLDVSDTLISGPLELLQRQAGRTVSLVKLFGTHTGIPSRLEFRQTLADLLEAHAIGSFIGTGIVRKLDGTVRHNAGDDLGQIPDAIIVGSLADIEGFIEDPLGGRLQRGDEGAGDVLDVHDRTPWRAV